MMPALGLTMQEIHVSAALSHQQAPGLPSADGSLPQRALEPVEEEAWLIETIARLARNTINKQDLSACAQRPHDALKRLAAECSQRGRTDGARLLSGVVAELVSASATLLVLHNGGEFLDTSILADSRASAVGCEGASAVCDF